MTGRALRKDAYFEKIGYRPHDAQRQIHYQPGRFKVIANGRRFGKTVMGGHEADLRCWVRSKMVGADQLVWVVGPQYTDTEKEFAIAYDTLRKLGVERDAIKFQNNRESGSLHIKTTWGFELIGKSAQHPETLVGDGLDFVLMVEAGRHKRRTWGEFIRPSLSDKRGGAMFTGVPEGRSEHSLLFSLWDRGQSVEGRKRGWRSWRMPSWYNTIVFPGGRQDPEILDAEDDLTKDEFDRQYGAAFVDKVGSVMQDWDDEIHLQDLTYRSDWPLYMAFDYGFTNDFVLLWIQVGPFGDIHVIREQRWKRTRTEEIAVKILAEYPEWVPKAVALYPDPAEPDRTETLQNVLHVPARSDTGGPLRQRLELIWSGLKLRPTHLPDGHPEKKPALTVDRSCKQLAWEMREGYRWPEHRSEVKSESEHPMDKDNHGPEALGRFFRGYFGVVGGSGSSVERVRIGR